MTSSPENKSSEILGLDNTEEDNKDKQGELVALDYDLETSKGERALKVGLYVQKMKILLSKNKTKERKIVSYQTF